MTVLVYYDNSNRVVILDLENKEVLYWKKFLNPKRKRMSKNFIFRLCNSVMYGNLIYPRYAAEEDPDILIKYKYEK